MVEETTQEQYYYGTGKRKTAIAKVRLYLNVGCVDPGAAQPYPGQWKANGRGVPMVPMAGGRPRTPKSNGFAG